MSVLETYRGKVVPKWCEDEGLRSPQAVPRVTKVTLNMGLKDALSDRKVAEAAAAELSLIAGQKAVVTRARKSIAGFKLREGQAVGAKVTLRRRRMHDFLDRLIQVALPRVRDFRGLSGRSFDGRGNYSLGINEHIVFPEINIEKVMRVRGLHVTITTNTDDDEKARRLLTGIGMPITS